MKNIHKNLTTCVREVVWWDEKGEVYRQQRVHKICMRFKCIKYTKLFLKNPEGFGTELPIRWQHFKRRDKESLGSTTPGLGREILYDWWGTQREKGKEENSHWAGWQALGGVEWICESSALNRSWSHVNAWKRVQGDKSKARSNRGRRRRKRWTRSKGRTPPKKEQQLVGSSSDCAGRWWRTGTNQGSANTSVT